jgi:hypothetical protein
MITRVGLRTLTDQDAPDAGGNEFGAMHTGTLLEL